MSDFLIDGLSFDTLQFVSSTRCFCYLTMRKLFVYQYIFWFAFAVVSFCFYLLPVFSAINKYYIDLFLCFCFVFCLNIRLQLLSYFAFQLCAQFSFRAHPSMLAVTLAVCKWFSIFTFAFGLCAAYNNLAGILVLLCVLEDCVLLCAYIILLKNQEIKMENCIKWI